MFLILFPNGAINSFQGNVSLVLVNVTSKRVFLSYEIQIGNQGLALLQER